ncbi:MAG: ribosome rescue GTPase HflX [Nevskiales bacterium]
MFERPRAGNRALLVHLDFRPGHDAAACAEFVELARSAGGEVLQVFRGHRAAPDPKFYCGSGKAAELAAAVQAQGVDLVVFNHELSPSQERNLEKRVQCRVLDRTGLILDIFAQRARSHEGKLQVELAQLKHLATRLVRGWLHLERQRGGIGLRGPGETQLETDRRLLAQRIKHLQRKLEQVRAQRAQGRAARRKHEVPLVAVVGYTNAGKSTLFNALTGAEALASPIQFATLDPTLRRLKLAAGAQIVLADTVGFVRELPHDLVEAFRATLEETRLAHLLLHVVDASDPERRPKIEQVRAVLAEIGADDVPQIEIFNKLDLCEAQAPRLERDDDGRVRRVYLSAQTGAGLDLLRDTLAEVFFADQLEGELALPPAAARLRARLFELGAVRQERHTDAGETILSVSLPRQQFERLCREEKSALQVLKQTSDLLAHAR